MDKQENQPKMINPVTRATQTHLAAREASAQTTKEANRGAVPASRLLAHAAATAPATEEVTEGI